MSKLNYFASDTVLEEQPNPYISLLSVNQALELGIEVKLDMFDVDFDKDEPDVILFCADETKFEYPNIYTINKEEYYDDIGTSKQFCTALEWNYSEDTVYTVLKYIQNHMKIASELELWSVWLGGEEIPPNVKKMRCKLSDLTVERLKKFYISELDFQCLVIVN
jgi:hypothetical protein